MMSRLNRYQYLLFNIGILSAPCIASLFYQPFVLPQFLPATLAISTVATAFIFWDMHVTGKFWTFNQRYITGLRIGKLPIEEVLFFFCIPLSCLLIWENLQQLLPTISTVPVVLVYILFGAFATLGVFFYRRRKTYTTQVLALLAATILFDQLSTTFVFLDVRFWVFLCIQLVLTLVFNFYLTAKPIVIYDLSYASGKRVLTIPVEDFIYGTGLLSLIVILYELCVRLLYS